MDPNVALLISVISLVASLIATLYAVRSTRIAERSLQLSLEQDRRQTPNINVYLIDGRIVRIRDKGRRVYEFFLRVSNNSDSDASLTDLCLVVEYSRNQMLKSNLIVSHDSQFVTTYKLLSTSIFEMPFNIGAKESRQCVALFPIDDELFKSFEVESYMIKIIDSHDKEFSVEPIILKEFYDDETGQIQDRV